MNTIQVNKKIHIFSLNKNPKSRRVEGCGAGTGAGRRSPSPSRVMAVDQAAELLGHGVYQLLLVPFVFPKLGKNVVFSARVPHLFQQDEGCRRVHAKILARGLPVVSQIR